MSSLTIHTSNCARLPKDEYTAGNPSSQMDPDFVPTIPHYPHNPVGPEVTTTAVHPGNVGPQQDTQGEKGKFSNFYSYGSILFMQVI